MASVVRPLPGPGLVSRSGDLLLVCAEDEDGVEALLDLVNTVTDAGGDGTMLVRRVAAVLAADLDGFSACAACGPTADGRLAVLVHGAATAHITGADGEVVLSAADAVTSVTRLIPSPVSAIRLEIPGAGTRPSQFARLDSGIVAAAGFVTQGLTAPGEAAPVAPTVRSGAPATAVEPAPVAVPAPAPALDDVPGWPPLAQPAPAVPSYAEPVSFTPSYADTPSYAEPASTVPAVDEPASLPDAASLSRDDELVPPPAAPAWAGPTTYAEPVPVASSSPAAPIFAPAPTFFPAEAEPAANPPLPVRAGLATEPIGAGPRATILGLACPNGHLNDPSLPACATCGAPLTSQPANLREGPRPALGVLTLDDGSAYPLDIDYVLGREPQHDPQVLEGTARPLKISDSEGVVSRRHLRVALNGWDIQVIDLGSANGTYAQYPGETQLHQLSAHHPVVVRPGTQVTLGRRWFRIDPPPTAS